MESCFSLLPKNVLEAGLPLREPEVHVGQVEVQRQVERRHRSGYASRSEAVIGKFAGRRQRDKVPAKDVMKVALDVGHRVGNRAAVEGVALDPIPQGLQRNRAPSRPAC
jgi:hypothetical protein